PKYTYGGDLDGDGLMDVLEGDVLEAQGQDFTTHWYALRNDGTATLNIAGGANDFGGAVYSGDFNGDGLADFYGRHDDLVYFSKGIAGGVWSYGQFPVGISSTEGTYYTGDFDGD